MLRVVFQSRAIKILVIIDGRMNAYVMLIKYYFLTSQAKYLATRNIYSIARTFILHDLEIYEDISEHLKPQFMRTNVQLKSFIPISGRAKK